MPLFVNLIVFLTLTTVTAAQEHLHSSEARRLDTKSIVQLEKDLFKAKNDERPRGDRQRPSRRLGKLHANGLGVGKA